MKSLNTLMFEHFGHNPKNVYQPFWTRRALPERSEARKMSIFGDSRRRNPTRGGCANQPSANPVRISGVMEESLCTRLSISNGLREFIHNFVIRLFLHCVHAVEISRGCANLDTISAHQSAQRPHTNQKGTRVRVPSSYYQLIMLRVGCL